MSTHALLIAALLTLCVGFAHSVLGEWKLIGPLLHPATRSGMLARSGWARGVLRFAWHLTTIAWWGFAAVLAGLAGSERTAAVCWVLAVTAVTFLVTAIVTLVSSRARHLAWPVFLAIAALSYAPVWR